MQSRDNRLMVLAISTRNAEKILRESSAPAYRAGDQEGSATDRQNALDSLAVIATELEKAARGSELEAAVEPTGGQGEREPSDEVARQSDAFVRQHAETIRAALKYVEAIDFRAPAALRALDAVCALDGAGYL